LVPVGEKEVYVNGTLALASAPAPQQYEPPALAWRDEPVQAVGAVIWAILVGFSLAAATGLATYCIYVGGSPSTEFTWRGFKVSCRR
jgi:hypothetical protein